MLIDIHLLFFFWFELEGNLFIHEFYSYETILIIEIDMMKLIYVIIIYQLLVVFVKLFLNFYQKENLKSGE